METHASGSLFIEGRLMITLSSFTKFFNQNKINFFQHHAALSFYKNATIEHLHSNDENNL